MITLSVRFVMISGLVVLTACASDTVRLRHPQTGKTAQCALIAACPQRLLPENVSVASSIIRARAMNDDEVTHEAEARRRQHKGEEHSMLATVVANSWKGDDDSRWRMCLVAHIKSGEHLL